MTERAPKASACTSLGLRRWTLADAEWYAEQASEVEIQKWTTERPDMSAEQVREAISGFGHDPMAWVILDLATGERLGNAAVEMLGEVASASYWVAKRARGRGVATRALRMMIAESAARGALRMELEIHQDNAPSRRVANKLGFVSVGESNHPMLGRCVRYSRSLSTSDKSVA